MNVRLRTGTSPSVHRGRMKNVSDGKESELRSVTELAVSPVPPGALQPVAKETDHGLHSQLCCFGKNMHNVPRDGQGPQTQAGTKAENRASLKDGRTHSVWKGDEMLPREWGRQWKCHAQKTQKDKEGFIMQLLTEKVKVLGWQGER